ncbi:MAG: hypothetical protein ACI8PZ_007009 [Myxococcota bacterium]|jgi:hypothetical protein
MLTLLAMLWTAQAGCDLTAPPDAPFQVELHTELAVQLLVEIWVHPDGEAWAGTMLDALSARSLHGSVVVPLPDGEVSAERAALLAKAALAGHEIVLLLDAEEVPRDALLPTRPLRKAANALGDLADTKIRTAVAPMASKHTEPLLGQAGFRTILTRNGPATGTPRPAKVFEGQPRIGVVVHTGPYAGDCGPSSVSPVWTPASADRVSQAILGAAAGGAPAVTRAAILGVRSEATDADVLGRWLDEVILPAGVSVVPPSAVRETALHAFRKGVSVNVKPSSTSGRLVKRSDALLAAEALATVETLPRELPGRLNPTEAFYAFTLLLTQEVEDNVVRVGSLLGPRTDAKSVLSGPVTLAAEDVRALAKALRAEWPDEVPGALAIGGQLLTASELLLAFASTVRGDAPAVARPVAPVDPNAAGLGWGASAP